MNNNFLFRVLMVIVMLASVFNSWWIVALIVGLISVWYFPYFVEFVVAGIIFDSLFGYSSSVGILGYSSTIVSVLLFFVVTVLKRVLRR